MQKIEDIYRARLRLLVKEAGTAASLARTTGKSAAQISQWLNGSKDSKTGKPRTMERASARELEAATGKQPGWMDQPLTDEERSGIDVAASTGKAAFDSNVRVVGTGKREYPVISYIQAGEVTEISDPYSPGDGFDIEWSDDIWSIWTFALELEGDSMLPDFRPKDRVLIDPTLAPNPGDFVAAKNGKNKATFKKYRLRGTAADGQEIFELVPLNPDFETVRSDEEQLEVIGVMVEHRKRFREPRFRKTVPRGRTRDLE